MQQVKSRDGLVINTQVFGNVNADDVHTIILAHGNGNRLSDWDVLGYFKDLNQFKVIAMDAIGYGASDKSYDPERYTPAERALDVIDVIDAYGINQCHYWGNSIGGSLGYVLALNYSNRFYSFSIGSAHPYGSTREPSNLYPKGFLESLASMQGLVDIIAEALASENREFIPELKDTFLQNDLEALIAANKLSWPDISSELSFIQAPVLLYAGDKDPVHQHVIEAAAGLNNVTLEILEQKTHVDVYWNGNEVAPLVLEFISNVSMP